MVDTYGNWTEEKDYTTYPKEKWCDYDRVANYIRNTKNYTPVTDIENLITMVLAYYASVLDDIGGGQSYTNEREPYDIEDIAEYVNDMGGLKEFDYYD